jgi:hypothetical protein
LRDVGVRVQKLLTAKVCRVAEGVSTIEGEKTTYYQNWFYIPNSSKEVTQVLCWVQGQQRFYTGVRVLLVSIFGYKTEVEAMETTTGVGSKKRRADESVSDKGKKGGGRRRTTRSVSRQDE